MAQYRSALGKNVDMTQIMARNEHVRAVGNMGVNARGDTIDGNNKIVTPVTSKVARAYDKTVGNRAANIVKGDIVADKIEEDLPDLDIDDSNEADEIEAIKAQEVQGVKIKPASEAPDYVEPETPSKKK